MNATTAMLNGGKLTVSKFAADKSGIDNASSSQCVLCNYLCGIELNY